MRARLAKAWDAAWTRPAAPLGLAAARTVLAAQALWIVLSRPDLPDLVTWPEEFWRFAGYLRLLRYGVGVFPLAVEQALFWLLIAALVAALLGVWARTAATLGAALLYHFAPFEEALSGNPHTFFDGLTLPILGLFVVGFAEAPRLDAPGSSDFRWPLSMIRLLLTLNYFLAGLAKLYYVGPAWFGGDNIRGIMIVHYGFLPTTLAQWLSGQPLLCWAIALGTFVFEFGFPLVVLSQRAAWAFLAAAVVFHVVIALSLGLIFLTWPALLVLVDWDAISAWRARRAVPAPASV
jgi:hypothetical protein